MKMDLIVVGIYMPGSENIKMEMLYALKLEGEKYYIGKTDNFNQRYLAHVSGSGAAWTRQYKPVSVAEIRPTKDLYDETNTTKEYMKKYGIDNVRGGPYCQLAIPDEMKSVLLHELRAADDACYTCGKTGHLANACRKSRAAPTTYEKPVKADEEYEWQCSYCPRTFTTRFGASVHQKSCAKAAEEEQDIICYRCGRDGHKSPDCYAKHHIKGYRLNE